MANRKKKRRSGLLANIAFSIITVISLTALIVVLLTNIRMSDEINIYKSRTEELNEYKNTHLYTEKDLESQAEKIREEENLREKNLLLEQIKETMDNGYSAYYMLRAIFPDQVVVFSDDGYNFYPISDEIGKNNYVTENFIQDEETEEITYVDDNKNILSKKGIDVSSFNGEIDWNKVAKSDVDFAYIRCGLRGSTEGKLMLDSTFETNIKEASKTNIPIGVYFFTQAVNENEADEEAKFLIEQIKDYKIDYPIALDIENLEGRTEGLSKEQRTKNAIVFLSELEAEGYKTIIYGNLNSLFNMLNLEDLEAYDKWFAYYNYPVYNPYNYSIWQYTSKGEIDGIKGNVDINVCMKNY
ncbi:MAG: glycoside hydrolase family 25 protein [Lachnospiraceae bacterium]|nr:glycoside hydrolase family 25 protein [Lachnospiraceae bacterium]